MKIFVRYVSNSALMQLKKNSMRWMQTLFCKESYQEIFQISERDLNVLNRDVLPSQTRVIFDFLSKDTALSDFVLIGGTALALQKTHRLSEDLDFWIPSDVLNKRSISEVINRCVNHGFDVRLATPQSKIINAKINGLDLLSGVQDYAIDGVKVTFLARYDLAYQHFAKLERISDEKTSFKVMGAEGIFSMKSHLIHYRTRSRDLFDLMTFVKGGKGVDEVLQAGLDADPAISTEYAKSVLRGDVPMDKEDEGFHSLGIEESIKDIHQFFTEQIDAYEQQIATCKIKNIVPPGKYIGAVKLNDNQIIQHLGRGKEINFDLNDFSQKHQKCLGEMALNGGIAKITVSINGKPLLTN